MKTTLAEARCAVDPTVQAFLDQINEPSPVRPTTPAEARAAESRMQDIDVAKLRADIEDGSIPGPSGQIGIRITRPLGAKEELPAVMYFHGGGWVVGDRDTHDRLVRDLAHSAHAAIVFVDYSRAPEAQYPVAIEEAYAATAWVKAHGRSVGLELAVAGDSAGGNMAAVVTLLAKRQWRPGDRLPGAVLPRRGCLRGHAVPRRVRGRVLPDTGRTRVGLGSVRTRPRDPSPSNGIAAAGDGRPIGRVASRPRGHRRTGHRA
jgi:acetyl esterase/lipase